MPVIAYPPRLTATVAIVGRDEPTTTERCPDCTTDIPESVYADAARAHLNASPGPPCTEWYATEWCEMTSRKPTHRAAVKSAYLAGQASILREWAADVNEVAGVSCTDRAAELLRRADQLDAGTVDRG